MALPSHLFISDSDGGLYDTRNDDWAANPIRPVYRKHYLHIETVQQLLATLRAGQFAWPGGYQMFFITSDGGALSFETVLEELSVIVDSIRSDCSDGWKVEYLEINYEDNDLFDSHTGKKIESAYGGE